MSQTNHAVHIRGNFADPAPYPEIKVLRPNFQYASLLMDDYAGVVSELTAINQYLYHHFFFKDVDNSLGNLMENVSIVEMLHMEMLADTIKKLGGDPKMKGSASTYNSFWSGKFVHYGSELCSQLKADIDSEYSAIAQYQKHIKMINDLHIQAILNRIILDEKVHIHLFNDALKKFCDVTYKPLS